MQIDKYSQIHKFVLSKKITAKKFINSITEQKKQKKQKKAAHTSREKRPFISKSRMIFSFPFVKINMIQSIDEDPKNNKILQKGRKNPSFCGQINTYKL